MASLLADLHTLASEEMAAGTDADAASNVGGFHGARDLWAREAVQESTLPWLVSGAVQQAARAEAVELNRVPISTSADEAWFNILGPGGWNMLHTHPGTTYSGALFVAGDASCSDQERLAGRLAFLPNAPEARCDNQTEHVLAADEAARTGRSLSPEHRYLLVDPVPGTCVIFPSFVPHFVLPTPAAADPASMPALRMSIAFNYGACDPVLAHVFTVPGPRVKLVLETVEMEGG